MIKSQPPQWRRPHGRVRSTVNSLALDIGQLLSDFPILHAENIDATDMTALAIWLNPLAAPANNRTVFSRKRILRREGCLRGSRKKLLPESPHRCLSLIPLAIGRWIGVFKDTVCGHGRHDRINIMAGKGIVEALQASLPLI